MCVCVRERERERDRERCAGARGVSGRACSPQRTASNTTSPLRQGRRRPVDWGLGPGSRHSLFSIILAFSLSLPLSLLRSLSSRVGLDLYPALTATFLSIFSTALSLARPLPSFANLALIAIEARFLNCPSRSVPVDPSHSEWPLCAPVQSIRVIPSGLCVPRFRSIRVIPSHLCVRLSGTDGRTLSMLRATERAHARTRTRASGLARPDRCSPGV